MKHNGERAKQSFLKATVLNDCFVLQLGTDQKPKAIENIPGGQNSVAYQMGETNMMTRG